MWRLLSILFRAVCVRGTQALLLASLLACGAWAAVAPPGTLIPNIAGVLLSIDTLPLLKPSNEVYVQVPFDTDRIGVAKQASQPIVNLDASGTPDGTATVSFTLRVRSYAQDTLSKVVLLDQIEGSGASQLGSYTPNAVPGVGQYTVLPNSLVLLFTTAPINASSLNQGFTGQTAASNLLQGEVSLPRGAEFTLRFDVRYNLSGRRGLLYNSARACAQTVGPPPTTVCDDSVDGFNPDVNGDGDPTNDGSPTPVPTQLPALALLKSVSSPRPTATAGVYEVDSSAVDATAAKQPAEPSLEEVLVDQDNALAFLGLKEGDVLSTRQVNLRVKGAVQGSISLKVNGEAVPDSRVGKRVVLEAKALRALEFVAVQLKPGRNQLEAELLDTFGNPRERVTMNVTAPGPLARLLLKVPETAQADGKTPIKVQVRLVDAAGVPVQARTVLNLDTSAGRWNVKDLNPAEAGVQVPEHGGRHPALCHGEPGAARPVR